MTQAISPRFGYNHGSYTKDCLGAKKELLWFTNVVSSFVTFATIMLDAQNVAPDSWNLHGVPKGPLIKVVDFAYVIRKNSENAINLSKK
jgi:hypothetical protein